MKSEENGPVKTDQHDAKLDELRQLELYADQVSLRMGLAERPLKLEVSEKPDSVRRGYTYLDRAIIEIFINSSHNPSMEVKRRIIRHELAHHYLADRHPVIDGTLKFISTPYRRMIANFSEFYDELYKTCLKKAAIAITPAFIGSIYFGTPDAAIYSALLSVALMPVIFAPDITHHVRERMVDRYADKFR